MVAKNKKWNFQHQKVEFPTWPWGLSFILRMQKVEFPTRFWPKFLPNDFKKNKVWKIYFHSLAKLCKKQVGNSPFSFLAMKLRPKGYVWNSPFWCLKFSLLFLAMKLRPPQKWKRGITDVGNSPFWLEIPLFTIGYTLTTIPRQKDKKFQKDKNFKKTKSFKKTKK